MRKLEWLKIGQVSIKSVGIAFDMCHKIYILENAKDYAEAKKAGYKIYDCEHFAEIWTASCPLKFVSTWDLSVQLVRQGEPISF